MVKFWELLIIGPAVVVATLIWLTERQARAVKRAQRRETHADEDERTTRRIAAWALIALFGATLVWRIRSADQLASNPLDAAGLLRISCDGLAVLFSVLAWMRHRRHQRDQQPQRAGGFRVSPALLYMLYVVVVILGISTAVKPSLVAFRVYELVAVPITVAVAAEVFSFKECLLYARRAMYALAALIFSSVILFPSQALHPVAGGIVPFRIEGVLPAFSANTVGTIGLMLMALAVRLRSIDKWPMLLGFALVLLSQYRTGYGAIAAMVIVWAVVRYRAVGVIAVAALAWPVYQLATSPTATELFLRGQTAANAATLTGRTEFWAAAIDVAQRSPIIGTGLTSGTRFEVFTRFPGYGSISTIHSTWIETYLGTGLVGLALIGLLFLQFVVTSSKVRELSLAPLLFAAMILVRSVTGSTIELFSPTQIVFALLAVATWRRVQDMKAEKEQLRRVEPLARVSEPRGRRPRTVGTS